jgi:integrase/recombinase XerD
MSESATVMTPEPMPMFGPVQLAAAGYLARYSGRTRDAYALDLKTYFAWCAARGTEVFEMTRPHVEVYVRWMEEQRHYAPATTARRLSTVAGYYRFAVIDGYLDRSPAEYVRRPHVPEESQVLGLDRMQLGALVATARASTPDEAALITMLGLLGLRIGEACSVDVEDMGTERGHRTLHIIGKGNKPALIPLPVPVARTLDLAAAERVSGPLLRTRTGRRMDRNAASRIVHRLARRAGIEHRVGCHALRHASSQPRATLACHCATSRSRHATQTLVRPPATTARGATWTAMPTMSLPPSSPELPDPRRSNGLPAAHQYPHSRSHGRAGNSRSWTCPATRVPAVRLCPRAVQHE